MFYQYLFDCYVNYYVGSTVNQTLTLSILVQFVSILNDYRKTYDNLKRPYERFGEFQYSDQRDQGKIKTKVYDSYGGYVRTESTIKDKNSSLIRSITVYKEGKIEEGEWGDWSGFRRWRVILESGFWEEYSIHWTTGFGIRKVVYPDGQQFTGEVYGWTEWERGWNAIGEETYAIQNKSIPYLLEDNEMEEYKFVSKDGSFKIIYLR